MTRIVQRRIGFMVALALIAGGAVLALPAAAQTAVGGDEGAAADDAAPGLDRDQALALAGSGTPEAVEQLIQYLVVGGAGPEEIAARAQELIAALDGADLQTVQAASEAIALAAEGALDGAEIVRFDIDPGYVLPEGALGFDFGTPDAELHSGFERVTAGDERLEGEDLKALRRPSDRPVISDGIVGVKKFTTALVNGKYRLILMTDDLGEWQYLSRPLGTVIRINGVDVPIITGDSGTWVQQAVLGSAAGLKDAKAQMSGGMIVLEFTVTTGKLEIEFKGASPTYLTGLVIEPASRKPDFVTLNPAADRILKPNVAKKIEQQVKIAEAIGKTLEKVITEAGEKLPVEERPPVQEQPVSPS